MKTWTFLFSFLYLYSTNKNLSMWKDQWGEIVDMGSWRGGSIKAILNLPIKCLIWKLTSLIWSNVKRASTPTSAECSSMSEHSPKVIHMSTNSKENHCVWHSFFSPCCHCCEWWCRHWRRISWSQNRSDYWPFWKKSICRSKVRIPVSFLFSFSELNKLKMHSCSTFWLLQPP